MSDIKLELVENGFIVESKNNEVYIEFTEIEELQDIVLEDGTVITVEEILQLLSEQNIDPEPAAGPGTGATGGGVSEYVDDSGNLIDGVDKLNGLDPRDFNTLLIEPIEAFDAEESLEDTLIIEPPVDTEDPEEPPVDPEDPEEPPVDTEDPEEPPVDPEDPEEPPVDPEDPEEPPVDPEDPEEPPVDPEDPEEPPVDPEEPPVDPEDPEEPENLAPQLGKGYAIVSDEGLDNANVDSDSYTNTYTGKLSVSDPNNDIVILSLVEPEIDVYSSGVLLDWNLSSDGTTLIGSANGTEIIKVIIDFEGNYTVTQSGQIDHSNPDIEDVFTFDVGVNASDGEFLVTSSITIDVQDDSPELFITDTTLAKIGADVDNAHVIWNDVTGHDLFVDGLPVDYEIRGSTIYGFTEDKDVFELKAFDDGTYNFEQFELFDNNSQLVSFQVKGNAGGPEDHYYITEYGFFSKYEGDGYAIKFSAEGDRNLVNPSAQGMGVDNNNIEPHETLVFEFDNEGLSGDVDNFYGATVYLGKENQDSDLVSWKAWFTDGSTADGTSNDLFNVNAPDGYYIDKIEVTGEVGKMTVPSVALFNEATDLDPGLKVEFTVYDGDHDSVSGSLDIMIEQATNSQNMS